MVRLYVMFAEVLRTKGTNVMFKGLIVEGVNVSTIRCAYA